MRRLFFAVIVMSAGLTASAYAQNHLVLIGESKDWSIYTTPPNATDAECGAISKPSRTANTRDGKIVNVRRGDIYLAVTVLPSGRYTHLVSFQAGYTIDESRQVTLKIGSRSFFLRPGTEGEAQGWAWPDVGEDDGVIDAMKKGRDAVIVAYSSRGTRTEDTFSLIGLTAALTRADECAAAL